MVERTLVAAFVAGLVVVGGTTILILGGDGAFLSGFADTGGEWQDITVNGETCSSKSDCRDLIVGSTIEGDIITEEEFETAWEEFDVDCSGDVCQYRTEVQVDDGQSQ